MNGIHKKLVPAILAMAIIFSTCFSNLGTIVYANREQRIINQEQSSELPTECSEDEEHCALNLLQQITNPISETEENLDNEETSVAEEEAPVAEEEAPVTEEEAPVAEEEAPVAEEEAPVAEEEEPVAEEEAPVAEEEAPVAEEEAPVAEEEAPVAEEEEPVTEEEAPVAEEEEPVTEEEAPVAEEEEPVAEEEEALIEDDTNLSNNFYNSNIKFQYNLRSISEYISTGSKTTDPSWSHEDYNYNASVDVDTSDINNPFKNGTDASKDGRVWADKSVTLGDEHGDFDVMLSALAQEYNTLKQVPANVVFILDVSWSMVDYERTRGEDAVNAINKAIHELLANHDETKVGVVTFNGPNPKDGGQSVSTSDASHVLLPLGRYTLYQDEDPTSQDEDPTSQYLYYDDTDGDNDEYYVKIADRIKNEVNTEKEEDKQVQFYGGTYTQAGIQAGANELIDAASEDRDRLPVLFLLSDGKPTFVYGETGVESGTVGSSTAGNAKEADIEGSWGYYPILTAQAKKDEIAEEYNYTPVFYTVGLGITDDDSFAKTVLNPNEANINSLLNYGEGSKELNLGNWLLGLVEGEEKYFNGVSYADYVKNGNLSSADLNLLAHQLAENTSKVPHSPFAISSETIGNSYAIEFTDVIGSGMKIKEDDEIIVSYGGENYPFEMVENGIYEPSDEEIDYTIINDYQETVSLDDLIIQVSTDGTGIQTLTWKIPEDLVPLYRSYDEYSLTLPIRLTYTVGLESEPTGNVKTYYTNAMDSTEGALTKAEFTLAANNTYYQTHEPETIFNKDSSGNVVNITDTVPYVSSENKKGQSMTVKLGNNGRLDVVKNVSKTVTKVWEDSNNAYGIRPESVTVNLLQNGTKIKEVSLNSTNNWSHTWDELPEFDSNGESYTYTVTEEAVSGYEASYNQDSLIVTNTLKTVSKTVTKVWEDSNNAYGIRPDSITVNLLQNNQELENKRVVLDSSNNWSYTWTGLPEVNQNGVPYTYTVEEVTVPGYESSYSEDTFTITNTLKTVSKTVIKVWEDSNNAYGIRPDSITVNLLQNNQELENKRVVLDSSNNWSYTWTGLPEVNQNGVPYTYTVEEVTVPGYESSYSEDTFTITNTLKTVSKTVIKVWEDSNNAYGIRPDSITVNLLQNNQELENKRVVLDSSNNWSYTWTGLPEVNQNGVPYTYTVEEVTVPGYVSSIEMVDNDTFEITNTLIQGSIQIDKKDKNGMYLSGVVFKLEKQEGNIWVTVRDQLTTDAGPLTVNNLLIGHYRLTEIKTVEDYKLLDSAIEFDIPYKESDVKLPNGVTIVGTNLNSSSPQLTITVTNYKNGILGQLPATGGKGVIGYVISASCLIGLSVGLYCHQVRRKNDSRN